jgi:DNA-binding CsgD family transcriptional regulator
MAAREETGPHGGQTEARRVCANIPNARLVMFDDSRAGFSEPEDTTPAAIQVINRFLQDLPGAVAAPGSPPGLSLRELEVLRLLAVGRSNQQIADELVISRNTVRRHVSNIFDKTGATNRVEASTYARDHGLA